MDSMNKLSAIRKSGGNNLTTGLPDATIEAFFQRDPLLVQAIEEAYVRYLGIESEAPELLKLDERTQMTEVQQDFVNFYAEDAVNPYVPLAARGPWIVTSKGAVVHDNGGYGMLGLGHAPQHILDSMDRPHVMANVMTPSFTHFKLARALKQEIGHRRGECPFPRFVCLNSGSEAVTVAARFSDISAKILTDPGGRYEGKTVKVLALKGGFHGRTDRPARFSDSSHEDYQRYLQTFRGPRILVTVEPNNIAQLREVFEQADRDNVFFEAFFMEPVMGEGNPGMAIEPEFYAVARELTKERKTLLLVDSIQAGLRTHGCLSIVDYPGFENLPAPDMETFSKALNAGQFPLSVLALTEETAQLYKKGVYGNTMTTNPRGMDGACAVLASLTPELRANIVQRGIEFKQKLGVLKDELGGLITKVQGTGLLVSCELDKSFKVYGAGSVEEYMRRNGVGVIHGGKHSIRYTPHFAITSAEIDLIVDATKAALLHEPKLVAAGV